MTAWEAYPGHVQTAGRKNQKLYVRTVSLTGKLTLWLPSIDVTSAALWSRAFYEVRGWGAPSGKAVSGSTVFLLT